MYAYNFNGVGVGVGVGVGGVGVWVWVWVLLCYHLIRHDGRGAGRGIVNVSVVVFWNS